MKLLVLIIVKSSDKKMEVVRWIGSIGVFYVVIPAAWLLTGKLYDRTFRKIIRK